MNGWLLAIYLAWGLVALIALLLGETVGQVLGAMALGLYIGHTAVLVATE